MGGAPFDISAMIPVAEERLTQLLGDRARDVSEELVAVYRSGVPERLNQDVYHVLKKLKAAGLKIGILSNGPSDAAPLEWLRDTGMVDATVLSGVDGVGKPSAQAFQLILDRLVSPADRSWFIDDDASHVEAARKLGLTGIHFRGDAGELERDPHEWARLVAVLRATRLAAVALHPDWVLRSGRRNHLQRQARYVDCSNRDINGVIAVALELNTGELEENAPLPDRTARIVKRELAIDGRDDAMSICIDDPDSEGLGTGV